ncbi:hypothetical protein [Draconibacterium mangrovi]|uniref:hypothetical protein n=1 Tax=Draconibacterium mangrovi TaxID=2697469 RepID=UPI0013D4BADE|nr:hypothetical protein [Draconibacterium mangrovi]
MNLHKLIKLIPFICLVFLFACDKENEWPELVINVQLIDENENASDDHSGVAITLTRGEEQFNGVTDSKGDCVFPDFPYGIFAVELEKNGFVTFDTYPKLTYHINDRVNTFSYKMNEVPQYRIELDSITKPEDGEWSRMFAYGRIYNMKDQPPSYYHAIAYFNTTNDVSKDNYSFFHYAGILLDEVVGDTREIWITNYAYGYLIPENTETLYVRLYPCAKYFDWGTIRDEALGEPSEVFEWVIPN